MYLHVYLTKSGFPPGPPKADFFAQIYTIHKVKRLNVHWLSKEEFAFPYWPSNWTVDLVVTDDSLPIEKLRGREKEFVDCDPLTSKYHPILYLNNH